MATISVSNFRLKQRDQLGDIASSSATFTDKQLDSWRDDEVGTLYARGLFKRDTNYGTEILITGSPTPLYYTTPTGFRRINRVEFVSTTDLTEIQSQSYGYDDLERPGFIRIPEAVNYNGYGIRVFGEKEYPTIDDTALNTEVMNVVLFGSCIRALIGEYVKRVESRRSQATTRRADSTPMQMVSGLAMMERKLQHSVQLAKQVQARTIQGIG